MLEKIHAFQKILNNRQIKIFNDPIDQIIHNFKCYLVENNNLSKEDKQEIQKQENESKIIIINKIFIINDYQFVIIYDHTILILSETNIQFSLNLIHKSKESTIFSSTEDLKSQLTNPFDKNLIFENKKFLFDIESRNKNIFMVRSSKEIDIKNIWELIKSSFISYLLHKSYNKECNKKIKINYSNPTNKKFNIENKFITIKFLGHTNSSSIELIYNLEYEELMAIKIFNEMYNDKKFERERRNYLNIQEYPLIPEFYGTSKIDRQNIIIIEYIKGKTLSEIKDISLSETEKIIIIYELILTIDFLQRKNYIYRDLKPNNVIIDKDKNAILIDFDRLVDNKEDIIDEDTTKYFSNDFICPEIMSGMIKKYTFKEDVYSIGLLIYYIIFEKFPEKGRIDKSNNVNYSFSEFKKNYPKFEKICEDCTETDPNNRPTIKELLEFFAYFATNMNYNFLYSEKFILAHFISLSNDYSYIYYSIGYNYYHGTQVKQDINKALHYLLLSSEQNNYNAQDFLGYIYDEGKYVKHDINKAIHYYTLAADQNFLKAQVALAKIYLPININKAIKYFSLAANQGDITSIYNLGIIFINGKYIQQDISKSLHYFTIAANQNHLLSQINIGNFYFEGKYVKQDINKSIYFFSLAAKQNNIDASFFLGNLYYDGKLIPQDIKNAIYYYKIAANQNHVYSQHNLGLIFSTGKLIPRDIDKSIHYFSLAANQHYAISQFCLGEIFMNEEYNKQNINKSIHYYTLAANQNYSPAQNRLGYIYFEGKYIKRDINKSLHYFTLAANQNNEESQFNLGLLYQQGIYVSQDISKSIYYYSLAANQNNVYAQKNLGNLYYEGKYTKQNIDKCIYYYSLAAKQNDAGALYFLGELYYKGDFIHRDMDKAIQYLTLSANQNHIYSQHELGIIYLVGEYVNRNIDKSIQYFTLASKQDYYPSQFNLGKIYYEGLYVPRDIKKAIHYFSLAANQNFTEAQYQLGLIYYYGNYIKKDINLAIHYFSLASKKNPIALIFLGYIYHHGILTKKDTKKAIHYYSLAEKFNNTEVQSYLGIIYLKGDLLENNINKSIIYLTNAANQNDKRAQFLLGLIYYEGIQMKRNVKKGIYFFIESAKNCYVDAYFLCGYFYHKGKYVEQNIKKAIHYYKEASSFGINTAKNNLGVIYKNGFGNEIKQNIALSIEYFQEAIRQKNDVLSMYNLSNIYIYILNEPENITKSIEMLINAFSLNPIRYLFNLLLIALIKKFGFEIDKMTNFINQKKLSNTNLILNGINIIYKKGILFNKSNFESYYEHYHSINLLYNFYEKPIESKKLMKWKTKQKLSMYKLPPNITSQFYEGFGNDF